MTTFDIDGRCFADAFGESGRPASAVEGGVPPNANLLINLELVSWKTVSDVTRDKKVLKKILKEGEGYERPNDGAVVQGNWSLGLRIVALFFCLLITTLFLFSVLWCFLPYNFPFSSTHDIVFLLFLIS